MPKYQYTEEEVPQFELLKNGDYPYEIVGFETDMSNKGRTNGCDRVTLKVKFFKDKTFETPVAQWSEMLTMPETTDKELNKFLQGRLNMFVKSANMLVKVGDEVEFTEGRCIGLRGMARVIREKRDKDSKDTDDSAFRNKVSVWLTDKEKFARVIKVEDEDEKPF